MRNTLPLVSAHHSASESYIQGYLRLDDREAEKAVLSVHFLGHLLCAPATSTVGTATVTATATPQIADGGHLLWMLMLDTHLLPYFCWIH